MPLAFTTKEGGRFLLTCALLALAFATAEAADKIGGFGDSPAIASGRSQAAGVKRDPDASPGAEEETIQAGEAAPEAPAKPPRKRARTKPGFWRKSFLSADDPQEPAEAPETADPALTAPEPPSLADASPAPRDLPPEPPPSPEGVELYRLKLEGRLLERYNNLPDHAGKVGRVTVILSRPLEYSLDNRFIKAEFDQIVLDIWGKRLPALEKEYFVVTFGSGGAEVVRSDPSVRVGLDMEKAYSERAPLTADPFRSDGGGEAFRPTPTVKMPEWWRPEFKDID